MPETVRILRLTNGADLEPNGKPIEIIYVHRFVLADRGRVLDVTEPMLDQIVANFARLGDEGRLPISVNHNSGGSTLEEAKAVGWITGLAKEVNEETDRISLMGSVHWTEAGQEAVESEEFRFISAELVFDEVDYLTGNEVGTRLVGCGLTNQPAIPQLQPITLTAQGDRVAQTLARLQLANQSLFEKIRQITEAFYGVFSDTESVTYQIEDLREEDLIVTSRAGTDDKLYLVRYRIIADKVSFAPEEQWVLVEKVYQPLAPAVGAVTGLLDFVHVQTTDQESVQLRAVAPHKTAMADPEMAWDGAQAIKRVRAWATDGEETDWAKYRQAFAWYDAAASDRQEAYKLPHHDIVDGRLVCVRRGVMAAGAACQRARGGVDIPDDEMGGTKRHLAGHYAQFDMEPPWAMAKQGLSIPPAMKGSTGTETFSAPSTRAAVRGTIQETSRMDELRTLLGIGVDDSVASAVAALLERVQALTTERDTLQAEVTDLKIKTESVAATQAALTSKGHEVEQLTTRLSVYQGEVETLSAQVKQMAAAQHQRETQDRLTLAVTQGKVTPAELDDHEAFLRRLADRDPETFDGVMAVRPVREELLKELGNAGSEPHTLTVDEAQREVERLAAERKITTADARRVLAGQDPKYRRMFYGEGAK